MRLRILLDEVNVTYVEDLSPSGGRHFYIPLQERLTAAEAREIIEALGRMATSLDASPHQNITDGCIRVPGSKHKTGGHQVLVTPLSEAYNTLRVRNSPDAVAALRIAIAPEITRNRAMKARKAKARKATGADIASLLTGAGSETALRRTARTGLYDSAKYSSPSEARMGVLNHFAACGWTLADVENELTGQFPGLAALYGTRAKQDRLLPTEWAKAQTYVEGRNAQKTGPNGSRVKNALINNTSPTQPTGGGSRRSSTSIHQLVNDLENILYAVLDHRLSARGREGLGLRLLIRGLLSYMRTKETDVVDVGCRTLAAALGKHHVTVARLLPILVQASDGILTKVADARYKAADVYLVELPTQYQQLARELTWRKGKIYALRPVFRALGDVCALVYEVIERRQFLPTTADIVRTSGISRSAVDSALKMMADLGMIHRDGRHWKVKHTASLRALADRLGVQQDYQAQINRNRRERAVWHAYLDRFRALELVETDIFDPEIEQYWLPPYDDLPVWHAS